MAVGADDHLLTGLVERVEGVKELLQDLLLALEELDIVQEKDVDSPVPMFEVIGSLARDRFDEVVEEVLRRDISDHEVGIHLEGLVSRPR